MQLTLTDHEAEIVSRALKQRADRLRRAADRCAGSLYPGIYAGEANDADAIRARLDRPRAAVTKAD